MIVLTILAYLFSFLCLLPNATLFVHLRPPRNFYIVGFQLLAASLSPALFVLGLAGAGLGWLTGAWVAAAAGLAGAAVSAVYIVLATRPQKGFEQAFGADWKSKIAPAQAARLIKRRWGIGLPETGEPRWERNIAFWAIPGAEERKLLCDVWQPPEGVPPSGLAIIYFHGSAWWILNKDFGTRPFFRQLAAQGHVVMDVAYRLCPEVDIYGMVGDVKRAAAWMKANAARYGANPERVVLAGASAGGHLSMLAAYAPYLPQLTPADVQDCDLAVRAVVSYYGPADLAACYRKTGQERMANLPKIEVGPQAAATIKKDMSKAGRLDTLLGGHLHEVPEIYALASPVTYVHADCPPTLLIQGEDDLITPVQATRELYQKLVGCGVPAVNIVYPLTNHAFDLLFPQAAPAAQSALYDLERFLALVA